MCLGPGYLFQFLSAQKFFRSYRHSCQIRSYLCQTFWKPLKTIQNHTQSRQSADTAAAFTTGCVARFLGWSGSMPEKPEPGHDDTNICLFGALVFVSTSVSHALTVYSYLDQTNGYHSKPFDTVRQSARSADRVAPFLGQMRVYLDNSLDMMKP